MRLQLGQLLEVIGRGPVFDLGFSSLGAYAVERCERSVRWAEAARCLARRLETLPALRRALAWGKVSWSMGDLLARVATPENEARWLELAQGRTVRQVRLLVAEAMAARPEAVRSPAAAAPGVDNHIASAGDEDTPPAKDDGLRSLQSGSEEMCIRTCTVDREDTWLFEATRCLLDQLGVVGAVAQTESLLAEAQSTLLALLPKDKIDLGCAHGCDVTRQPWLEQVHRRRDAADASCEKNVLDHRLSTQPASPELTERLLGVALAASLGITPLEHASCTALDQEVRAIAAALARHELEMALLVLHFHRANGWRRLGYASESQYARERLGLCRSSLLARRRLALRLEELPGIAAALGAAQIGVEAALQLVHIATPKTEAAWIDRARRRTIKHLREEVAAALVAVRLARERDCLPPEDTEMAAFQKLEQTVVSGAFDHDPFRWAKSPRVARPSAPNGRLPHFSEPASEARRAWFVMLASLASWLDGGFQMSAAGPGTAGGRLRSIAGRVTLRLRMSREAYVWWHDLEAQARRCLPSGVSWIRFLCLSMWQAWGHLLGAPVAYGRIYIRDRFRCTSPVCRRRDVTPHHLEFRSMGGSDEDHNITSLCAWCHLRGVHGGRIRALGVANDIRWELGPKRSPVLIVHRRDRMHG